jgi:hypothetical protein
MANVLTRAGDLAARRGSTATVAAGAAGGIAGGVAMALFLVLAAAMNDLDPLHALRPLGATFVGPHDGHAFLVYGIFVHLAVSALLGVLFVAVLPAGYTTAASSTLGGAYGVFAAVLLETLIVPRADPTLQAALPRVGGSWILAVAIYGAVLGAFGPRLRAQLAPHR